MFLEASSQQTPESAPFNYTSGRMPGRANPTISTASFSGPNTSVRIPEQLIENRTYKVVPLVNLTEAKQACVTDPRCVGFDISNDAVTGGTGTARLVYDVSKQGASSGSKGYYF
jgi:hypothetical protein